MNRLKFVAAALTALLSVVPASAAEISVDGAALGGDFPNVDGCIYLPSETAAGVFPVLYGEVSLGGESYVPLRLNCELAGFSVSWNAETSAAEVTTAAARPTGPAIETVRESAGYRLLDEKERERFDSFVFESRAFTDEIYEKTSAALEEGGYGAKSPDEQAAMLIACLKTPSCDLVDIGPVPDLAGGVSATVGQKIYFPSYDVWQGRVMPVWGYEVEMSDGYAMTVFTAVEDCSVVADAARALARFPLPVRRLLNRIIHFTDSANNYNGAEGTVWIRLDHIPDEDAIARTLAHELGHVLDAGLSSDDAVWDRAVKADMVPVSTYGNGNRDEDLAEFCRLYFMTAGDSAAAAAVEKVYPNRSKALRALLYAADGGQYAAYAADYEELSPYEAGEPVYVKLSPANSRMVLTVRSETGAPGEGLILAKDEGRDDQLWWLRRRTDGGVTLFSKATGYCVSVPGRTFNSGAPLVTADSPGRANETWTVTELPDGSLTFRARHSEQYLGFDGAVAVQTLRETHWNVLGR